MKDIQEILILAVIVAPILYPIWGGVMYGNPWKCAIKENQS